MIGARTVVLLSDRGLVAPPLPERAVQLARQGGSAVEVFSEVHPNPTAGDVDAGGAFVRAAQARAVVSLGGESALDAAKAIALAVVNDRPAAELTWSTEASAGLAPALPILAIPTTSGTGSECDDLGVVTDPRQQRKCYLGGPACLARYALLDPEPAAARDRGRRNRLPDPCRGVLSLRRAHPRADGLDLHAVRLVAENLRRALRFAFHPPGEAGGPAVMPSVDVIALTDLIDRFELDAGMSPGRWRLRRTSPARVQSHHDRALPRSRRGGRQNPAARLRVLGLLARSTVTEDEVVWDSFGQPHRPKRDYRGFGPFRFARAQYDAAVLRFASA
ncbi:Alcohol dehydrogenase [Amycolatopsis sp. M39]|nr:Alcohol dehydrogenase [Amycolatopsis sp. M39]